MSDDTSVAQLHGYQNQQSTIHVHAEFVVVSRQKAIVHACISNHPMAGHTVLQTTCMHKTQDNLRQYMLSYKTLALQCVSNHHYMQSLIPAWVFINRSLDIQLRLQRHHGYSRPRLCLHAVLFHYSDNLTYFIYRNSSTPVAVKLNTSCYVILIETATF